MKKKLVLLGAMMVLVFNIASAKNLNIVNVDNQIVNGIQEKTITYEDGSKEVINVQKHLEAIERRSRKDDRKEK